MATKYVNAVHRLTGIVQEIPESHLELIPAFEIADESKVKEAHRQAEIEMYGEPLGDKDILEVVADLPDQTWRKDDLLKYAEDRGVIVAETDTKAEILAAIHTQEGVN
jgi:hypothetical protein